MSQKVKHRFILRRVLDAFEIEDIDNAIEALMIDREIVRKIDLFLSEDGPIRINFSFERNMNNNATRSSSQSRESNELVGLIAYFDDISPQPATVAYFIKTKSSIDNNKLSEPSKSKDNAYSFGIIHSPLETFDALIKHVYRPVLQDMSPDKWKYASSSHRSEFLLSLDTFSRNLEDSLRGLEYGFVLRQPDERIESLGGNATANPVLITRSLNILQDWCRSIERYLSDHDRSRWDSVDAGVESELSYWKNRTQRLTSITEQFKKKSVQSMISFLTSVTKLVDVDPSVDIHRMNALLSQWHEIDVQITEAANEAKDNIKYLSTLERFFIPLNGQDIQQVIEIIPALLNAVKMIHTISRYFNTTDKLTKLFMKVANQLIQVCKRAINGNQPNDAIWNQSIPVLLTNFEKCFQLNDMYRATYKDIKEKLLLTPNLKQFNFPEIQIFGKFDLFCQRLTKLMDLFSIIHQYNQFIQQKFENLDEIIESFVSLISSFRGKGHDLLDYHNNRFDRDYVDFNEKLYELEIQLQQYINRSFEKASLSTPNDPGTMNRTMSMGSDPVKGNTVSIERSIILLMKYKNILYRNSLRNDLDTKLAIIFQNYSTELICIEEMYEKQKNSPSIARNMPPVSGNILWARHLLRKIETPMKLFDEYLREHSVTLTKDLSKESKRIIKQYNKLAKTLIAFELLWYEAWMNSIESAKKGLHTTLIVRNQTTNALQVNFDMELFQLMREAKCLVKLGLTIPENAKLILLQEDKFKVYFDDLKYLLLEYDRVMHKVVPIIRPILEPLLQVIEEKWRPGIVTLTWTSLNIDQYKSSIVLGLQRFDELINKVNDIIENRIQKNLRMINKTILVDLPNDTVTIEEFVGMQENASKIATGYLSMKNIEIENAVYDIFDLINQSWNALSGVVTTSPSIGGDLVSSRPMTGIAGCVHQSYLSTSVLLEIHQHFQNLTYQAILTAIKNSLIIIKKRAHVRSEFQFQIMKKRPFFEVDVQLSVSNVRLSPTLIDIQKAINRSTVAVLSCAKKIYAWDIRGRNLYLTQSESERVALYDKIGKDTEVVKMVLLLTGAISGVKKLVHETMTVFDKFQWLWKDDKETTYRKFIQNNPSIDEFELELKKFLHLEDEIQSRSSYRVVGVIILNTNNMKNQLIHETRQWKLLYAQKVYILAKEATNSMMEYIRIMTNKLLVPVQSLDNLGFVMNVLKELRERESSINIEVNPILDMYAMLERYLPEGTIEKEEIDKKSSIYVSWRRLLEQAEHVTHSLSAVQGKYKSELVKDIREFGIDIRNLRKVFDDSGPMVPGIQPNIALERLKKFKEEISIRERRLEVIRSGETLFALRPTRFNEIVKTKKEIMFLDTLYSLYSDVMTSIKTWSNILWSQMNDHIPSIQEIIQSYDSRLKKLSKKLKEWIAYDEVSQKISDVLLLLPLLTVMSKPSIKPRHWQDINNILANQSSPKFQSSFRPFRFTDSDFRLIHILNSGIVRFKDEVEEICNGADKQLQIEKKLVDLKDHWTLATFEFVSWKSRDVCVLKSYGFIVEDLEEAQQQLQSLLAIRHVTPFREEVSKFLTQLSDTADTLEMWVKVQMLWTSLESVFLGGDIAKQMPIEAKKFSKINKDWEKIMSRAAETKLVIACCNNELLRTTLPALYSELEKCQKSLEGYLEQKRSKFPRFYFVSNPVLLIILSQGSNPQQMQPYYEKVFDSIDHVTHSKSDRSLITEIQSNLSNQKETIPLWNAVRAVGNIEEWLTELENEMQRSLKRICELACVECLSQPIRQFVNKSCGQFALLGLQVWWTTHCNDALAKAKLNKQIMSDTGKLISGVLSDLSSWCLEDLGSQMNRIKIETLITIQVHQRDVFMDLQRLFKEKRLSDSNDFEWLKQMRFTWQNQSSDRLGQGACVISICDVDYKYSFEYLGCKERLVITPLTDRCFITLSQAMGMCLGGAPSGPAGTGKTETVKDLGRAVGVFVVVTNCTDQQRYTDMARIFKGLCQAGLWGCFDEFNRIELPVLSVVAQQVLAITNAKRSMARSFTFPGDSQDIPLNRAVGYFITMNPGYQGRQELPENLKVLFRGVAMMVPDKEIIIKVKLCSVGYQNFADLARKFSTLYTLCEQQLSKQKHYDFGLRNILSVLRSAGQIKRNRVADSEDELMKTTLRDMNLSKLVAQDVSLFKLLITDLFPSSTITTVDHHENIVAVLKQVVVAENLILQPSWMTKVIQLYDTTLVRHGIMMVGPSGSGKSKIMSSLQESLTQITGISHKRTRINPKAIRTEEMFGETDKLSGEWVDGIFSSIWSKFNDRNRKDVHWIICDGPVDAIWIENLNTVLDDNRILTLANGDRIPMIDNVKLMFEVEDLRNASPATVSRAGIIYVSASDLDWEPFLAAWISRKGPLLSPILSSLFKKYVGSCEGPKSFGHLFSFLTKSCKSVISVSRIGLIEGCCHLLDGLLEICDISPESASIEVERLFLYCVSWSIGGLLENEGRKKFTQYLISSAGKSVNDVMPDMESNDTIFEYKVNPASMDWEKWKAPVWKYPSIEEPDFSTLLVPTVESTRALFLMHHINKQGHSVLLTGGSGTAKSSTVSLFFESLQSLTLNAPGNGLSVNTVSVSNQTGNANIAGMKIKKMCFSFATTPSIFQSSIEAELDKRGGKNFGPPGGKKIAIFLDDLSMPETNTWGDQPTLELVRQLIESSGFYFLDKDKRGDMKNIEDVRYIAAMNHPGGGKQDIPNRLKRHFFIFNMILPSTRAINEIYGQMMKGRFIGETSFFTSIVSMLPNVTVRLWNWMRQKMLPSPTKFHYTFNLRDLSRVFQGILRTPKRSITDTKILVLLWRHECERVFSDKLTSLEDKRLFKVEMNRCTDELISVVNPVVDSHQGSLRKDSQGTEPPSPHSKQTPTKVINVRKKGTMIGGDLVDKSTVSTPSTIAPSTSGPISSTTSTSMLGQQLFSSKLNQEDVKVDEVYFVDFLRDDEYDDDGILVQEAPKVYEYGGSLDFISHRVQYYLNRYNEVNSSRQMNVVLFDDAMRHLMRITRCLGMPKGCLLLVGVGGSGKQSLTRLASFCAGSQLFQITISKTYGMNSLLDDIRNLYKSCGQQGTKITFLITEAEIKDDSFLEVINSILTTGEVTNLIPKDELVIMASELRSIAVKQIPNFVDSPDNLVKFFMDRVRSNLHLVLCMSPLSAKFSERARKFPGIVGGCTIDWFFPWPKEALIAVSQNYLSPLVLSIDDKADVNKPSDMKSELIHHMGMVHKHVSDICDEYYSKFRRKVYHTPKSFLQFLTEYVTMYNQKCSEIIQKASRVEIGLEKLQAGAQDVERMKITLAKEEMKLKESDKQATLMLSKLELSSMEAKREADAVSKIKEQCQADAERIAGEKADAEEDLAKAQPFVEEAERAVGSIKPNDLNELKKLGKPSDIIKLIFDCVSLLKMNPLTKVEAMEVTLGIGKDKKTFMFIKDSYKIVQTGMLSDARFLSNIMQFSKIEKDFINDETIEFLAPYLNLEGFNPTVAKNASKAAEGLCTWVRAMADYHEASKIVKPKLEALRLAEARLQDAERELFRAESRLKGCQDVLEGLQADFDRQLVSKRAIEENAMNTRKRMEQATSLIQGLASERHRWNTDREEFANIQLRLVGNVALACAFVIYCGAFNQEYRELIIQKVLPNDLKTRKIPFSSNLDLTDFLCDIGTIGDWNLEGLPADQLSIQNGILMTRSSRYPLLIDPQGQALRWIVSHEESRLPPFGTVNYNNARFREQLEYCLAEGKTLIATGLDDEIDPMLTTLLEKQIITKAKNKYVNIAGKLCDYNDRFALYLVTRLSNPNFSPEDQSKCMIVDFTVTMKGLEEQLLGRVIRKEQRSLEESLKNVLEEVTNNTKALLRFDQILLERLSENNGNLLDDEELINVLADTKTKAMDVKEKLNSAADMKRNISDKREQYRAIATRGSILYFSIVDMSLVNTMYQTSLDQFQHIFDKAMDMAEKANLSSKRINNIIDSVTYSIYRYINRSLYEYDKTSFKLIMAFKILLTCGKLAQSDVLFFLRGGVNVGDSQPATSHPSIPSRAKPFAWINQDVWNNIQQLTASNAYFTSLVEELENNEQSFLLWFNEVEPEKFPVPIIEGKWYGDDEIIISFNRLLAIRCFREDRTILAVNDFIRRLEFIDVSVPHAAGHNHHHHSHTTTKPSSSGGAAVRIPALGPKYVDPITDTLDAIYREMDSVTPVVYLLSAGADPTDAIELFSKRKRKDMECISMGEGQDVVAMRAINAATVNGSWVLLQNGHLGLDFMESLEEVFNRLRHPENTCSTDFRLFITTEPHPKFSIGLLQMSLKVTNEPPKGLRAGLQRSYSVIIDQDRLERIESSSWRVLLFSLCFLHSMIQERRKFGPLGWCVPYEFNEGDLNATISFLEKHLESSSTISWSSVQYMVAEVHYGGRITDSIDRRLFAAYTETYLSPNTLNPGFSFNPDHPINKIPDGFHYRIPDYVELDEYQSFIQKFPNIDSPEILGMHPNADLTFRYKEVHQLLNTIINTLPRQSHAVSGGKSRDDIVLNKCQELLNSIPTDYIEDDYEDRIVAIGGLEIPLNIFLFQEIQRFQTVLVRVKTTLDIVIQAIRGEVVVTADILDSIDAINDGRVVRSWLFNSAGDELSWFASNLSSWYVGLLQRDSQYRQWLQSSRPHSFWFAGFFNPQGFLTAVQQELTRSKKNESWSLDTMTVSAEVTDIVSSDHIRSHPKEGVFIHGLFLDGAAWNTAEGHIIESSPSKLFCPMPVLLVSAGVKSSKRSSIVPDYDCPVYKYPNRTDKYKIFHVSLPTKEGKPLKWTLRGVALLCQIN